MFTLTAVLTTSLAGAAVAAGLAVPLGSPPGADCGAIIRALPADLKHDLRALDAMTPPERRAAVAEIRSAVQAGEYGARVQRFATTPHPRLERLRKALPADLKADLVHAYRLPQPDQRVAMQEIRADALAGEYGERVQRAAERVQERCS